MTTNQANFAVIYAVELAKAATAKPEEYMLRDGETGAQYADRVAPRMVEAFIRGSANKDGPACRATCKALGIKHTYTAIRSYLAS